MPGPSDIHLLDILACRGRIPPAIEGSPLPNLNRTTFYRGADIGAFPVVETAERLFNVIQSSSRGERAIITGMMFGEITNSDGIVTIDLPPGAGENLTNETLSIFQYALRMNYPEVALNIAPNTISSVPRNNVTLFDAVISDNFNLVRELIAVGVDINAVNEDGDTALDISARIIRDDDNLIRRVRQRDITKLLLAKGARPKFETILYLIEDNSPHVDRYLKIIIRNYPDILNPGEDGIDINRFLSGRFTLLMMAALNNNVPILGFLLDHGADVNAFDRGGYTALMHAVRNNHFDIVMLLIAAGADVNVVDQNGDSPLMVAARNGSLKIVMALVRAGAEVLMLNGGRTAEQMAASNNHQEVVQFLKKEALDRSRNSTANEEAIARFWDAYLDPEMHRSNQLVSGILEGRFIGLEELTRQAVPASTPNSAEQDTQYEDIFYSPVRWSYHMGEPHIAFAIESRLGINIIDRNSVVPDVDELIGAIRVGNFNSVHNIILRGANVNAVAINGDDPLGVAVNYLMEQPLSEAAKFHERSDIIKLLLAKGVKPTLEAVQHILKEERYRLLDFILQKYPDLFKLVGRAVGHFPQLTFFIGISHNCSNIIKALISALIDANFVCDETDSASNATDGDRIINVINCLIMRHHDNLDVVDSSGDTIFIAAVRTGNYRIVEALIDAKVNLDARDANDWTAIMHAIRSGRIDIIEKLIAKGADVNVIGQDRNTPLLLAVRNNSIKIVRMLLEAKADVTVTDQNGNTPLMLAVEGNLEILRALLTYEANIGDGNNDEDISQDNINVRNNDGDTAILIAVRSMRAEVVDELISADADINVVDRDGNSPLLHAIQNGSLEIVRALLSNKAKFDIVDPDGNRALVVAVRNGDIDIEIVRALIDIGANIDDVDKDDKTAEEVAARNGRNDIVELIRTTRSNKAIGDVVGKAFSGMKGAARSFTSSASSLAESLGSLTSSLSSINMCSGDTSKTKIENPDEKGIENSISMNDENNFKE